MVIREETLVGQELPRFYGVAWYDNVKRVAVCYPVPFNWLMWLGREVWLMLIRTPETKRAAHERELMNKARKIGEEIGYARGVTDGDQAGYLSGLVKGRDILMEELMARLDNHGTR